MKFLCVPCDSPMKLQTVTPPDRGSLSVVYACPECGYEIAMLTNAHETQVVQSLGVRIGPGNAATAAAGASTSSFGSASSAGSAAMPGAAMSGVATSGGGCPFTGMIPAADSAPSPIRWTSAAEARLANIPAFVRPMARTGIESFARERGLLEVDERILDAAREFFGM
jgi:hypothetical protein